MLASAHVQWKVLDPGPILAFTLTSPGTAPVGTEVWLSYPRTALYLGCSKPGGILSGAYHLLSVFLSRLRTGRGWVGKERHVTLSASAMRGWWEQQTEGTSL